MFRRIVYLKDWIDDDIISHFMAPIAQDEQYEFERLLGIPQGNIVLGIEKGCCQIVVYCPTPQCRDILLDNQQNLTRCIKKVIRHITRRRLDCYILISEYEEASESETSEACKIILILYILIV